MSRPKGALSAGPRGRSSGSSNSVRKHLYTAFVGEAKAYFRQMLQAALKEEHAAVIQYLRHAYLMGEGEEACEIERPGSRGF